MKIFLLIGLICASGVLAACGGGSASDEPEPPPTKVAGTATPPRVQVPAGPPPAKVIVKDLRKGDGVPLKEGSRFTLNYVAVDYKTGKPTEVHWEKSGGFGWQFGKGKLVKGWVIGLRGMRVGGRRELIVPSRLAYNDGARVYVIDLLEVQ